MQLLDRPVWSSLTTAHRHLSEGNGFARRYVPEVNVFASAADDNDQASAGLGALVDAGRRIYVMQVPDVIVPPGIAAVKLAKGVQMVATSTIALEDDADIVTLTQDDAPEMLALATLTEPGPFRSRTHEMGHFRGIRLDGRLAAMAGERMRFPGYTEVSAVCTHPDFRGRGLARRLSRAVAAAIQARGETPFLHAWKANHPAIALYETLGFRWRTDVNVAVLERQDAATAD